MLKKILATMLALIMMLSLTACGVNKPTDNDAEPDDGKKQERVTEEPKETKEPKETEEPEKTAEPEETAEPAETEEPTEEPAGVSADFKAVMDEYEKFIDKYVKFMKKYEEEGRPLSMLSEYTELLTQYTEFAETMAAYNGDNLSAADYAYYIEVMGRVSQKLLELT